MHQEFYEYYADAPIFRWVLPLSGHYYDMEQKAQQISGDTNPLLVYSHMPGDKEKKSTVIHDVCVEASSEYDLKLDNDVKEAFDSYDVDGNGTIDRDELAQMMVKLGHELRRWHAIPFDPSGPLAQLVRASVSYTLGCRFESCRAYHL